MPIDDTAPEDTDHRIETAAPAIADRTATAGSAARPPMGWNSWNAFRKEIDEDIVKAMADTLVESGMRDAGYEYLVVDGGWRHPARDADGNMQVDREKFPNGMSALADYVHDRGLKFGLHQAVGRLDCAGETPGTQSAPGGEAQDIGLFAEWGIDFLKYDLCRYEYPRSTTSDREVTRRAFERMGQAIAAVDRDILYSVSEYGRYRPWQWAADAGADMWRTTPDIDDSWDRLMFVLDRQDHLAQYAGPGGWNDPDMLVVADPGSDGPHVGGLSLTECRAHMSLWSILAAPLFAGNDLRTMSDDVRDLLCNEAVIAVNQDPAGIPGRRVRGAWQEIWSKPLANGDVAAVLLNRRDSETAITTTAAELGMPAAPTYHVDDLWTGDSWTTDGRIDEAVPSHGAVMLRLSPETSERSASDSSTL